MAIEDKPKEQPHVVLVHIQMDDDIGPCGSLVVAKLSDGSMQFSIGPAHPLAAPVVAVQPEAIDSFIRRLVAAFMLPAEPLNA